MREHCGLIGMHDAIVQKRFEYLAVMYRRVGHRIALYPFVGFIRVDVVLVAVVIRVGLAGALGWVSGAWTRNAPISVEVQRPAGQRGCEDGAYQLTR